MRTTLKRGVGRGATLNGSNRTTLPPGPLGPMTVYRQPPAPPGRGRSLLLRAFGWAALVLCVLVGGTAAGAYLYLHESVAAVAPKSVEVKAAAKQLDVPLPGQPATALVIGYDHRANESKGTPSRSDTIMLVRADPSAKTISLLSFPRDLRVDIYCPGESVYRDKVNAAYSNCGAQGTLQTIRKLTGLSINYIITVNFRGFRQLVDKLGGVWMDIDRRYYNDHGGPEGYAKINLQPGYQLLTGYKALDFVRFRHTDSDIYRNARQQQFIRAFKNQIDSAFSLTKLPQVIRVVTSNVEVGQGGGKNVSAKTVLSYGLLAYSLPPGHVFQERIEGLEGFSDLTTAPENIQNAVRDFTSPDVDSPQKATAVALGEKVKRKAPAPRDTSVTVLNGNGIEGSASTANYLLSQRGYRMVLPPNGLPANAPNFDFFRTTVYFDARTAGAKGAARKLANLFGSADVKKLTGPVRTLGNGAMVVAVVGQTFHGRLASAPIDQTPKREPASVTTYGASEAVGLLRDWRRRINYPMMVPTKIADGSSLDPEKPIRVYRIDPDGKHKAIRLTYRLAGANEYWGVQMSDWDDAPVLSDRNFVRRIGGRRYELYYNGPHLHMVVLRTDGASYWVVNSLLDRLSNETMIAIAKGLRPLAQVSRGA
ncbi:LCP family protein [Gaiella sp.]|jgi:LCP family protein required for cell wall assembly|uniref:LCP family protein n=1 Tax=Gaiella sp. TaxID=2663207 RepID=UPI002E2EABDA|nr:LCP family protein [Gaiella sp.]HEX5583826.1 LCP family protein [Gaiella sp.]